MILIDLNQIMYTNIMAQASSKKNIYDENLVRHIVFNAIRFFNREHSQKYGKLILCSDSRNYWRKQVFPYYKAGRKKVRDASEINWEVLFPIMSKIKEELKEHSPYRFIEVDGAEADDIIGVLVPRIVNHEDVLIISRDRDFIQLQRYNGNFKVRQLDPVSKAFLHSEDPLLDLKIKIIKGDAGDGIPNILSPSDCFITETRQKRMTEGKLESFLKSRKEDMEELHRIGFCRNEILIDLSFTPKEIKEQIINNLEEDVPGNKQKLLNYFLKNKLMALIECIEEF